MSAEATNGNPQWQNWYPKGVVPDMRIPLERSPYGAPNSETLNVFAALLPPGSTIGDIGGGEARYGLPLARMGFDVVITDVDKPHLIRARNKVRLPGVIGKVDTRLSDATGKFPIEDGSLDGVLNAGFGYLMPPEQMKELFGKMTATLRPGGVMVFEFATNRDRRASANSSDSLIGENEYNYGYEAGMDLLNELYAEHGFRDFRTQEKTIHLEQPYYLHTDLIIASGIKMKQK